MFLQRSLEGDTLTLILPDNLSLRCVWHSNLLAENRLRITFQRFESSKLIICWTKFEMRYPTFPDNSRESQHYFWHFLNEKKIANISPQKVIPAIIVPKKSTVFSEPNPHQHPAKTMIDACFWTKGFNLWAAYLDTSSPRPQAEPNPEPEHNGTIHPGPQHPSKIERKKHKRKGNRGERAHLGRFIAREKLVFLAPMESRLNHRGESSRKEASIAAKLEGKLRKSEITM